MVKVSAWRALILAKLENYRGIDVQVAEKSISVMCKNPEAFGVTFEQGNNAFTVSFDGWHEEFTDQDEALNCFAFGLSKESRLKVLRRGGKDCRWTLQHMENGVWLDDSTTGFIVVPFWRSAQYVFRHNNCEKK